MHKRFHFCVLSPTCVCSVNNHALLLNPHKIPVRLTYFSVMKTHSEGGCKLVWKAWMEMPSLTLTSLTGKRNSPCMTLQGDMTNQLRAKNRKQKILLIVPGHVLRRLDPCPYSAVIAWGSITREERKKGILLAQRAGSALGLGKTCFGLVCLSFGKDNQVKRRSLVELLTVFQY